ncbi:hypothetical protein FACS189434_08000 [Bacteroidia bacterium]|nr:hypothetical protein FACS189434_08000 [Bacteroidia bacterium]
MKLPDFINQIAAKSGKQNDPAIIGLLSNANLVNIDLSDETANAINSNLLTIDGAKNNVHIKNHFASQALNGIDAEVLNGIKGFDLGDDFLNEISGEKNSYEKTRKVFAKLKEAHDAIKTSKGNGNEKDVEKYTKQINDLNSQISKIKETYIPKTEHEKAIAEKDNSIRDFMVHSHVLGLNYANKDIDKDLNIELAKLALKKSLEKSGAIVVKDGNELKLKQSQQPELDYYDSQQKAVIFNDFLQKTLAENKLLAVSGGGGTTTSNTTSPIIPNGGIQVDKLNLPTAETLGMMQVEN